MDGLFDLLLAARSQTATREVSIVLESQLDFLITECFTARVIHVDVIVDRIAVNGKARSFQPKANERNEGK
jgi:hypothetical protein